MSTWIVGGLLALAVIAAVVYAHKHREKDECAACPHRESCERQKKS